jgi:hypothetical protein
MRHNRQAAPVGRSQLAVGANRVALSTVATMSCSCASSWLADGRRPPMPVARR